MRTGKFDFNSIRICGRATVDTSLGDGQDFNSATVT